MKVSGAIIFSFDDQAIDDWTACQALFDEYGVKATFFICRPHLLTEEQITDLRCLAENGHEIACHGMNHRAVSQYRGSLERWVDEEIIPAKETLQQLGFECQSFAYPFGDYTDSSDLLIEKEFSFIRKAMYNHKDTLISVYDEIFACVDSYHNVNAIGTDVNYKISLENLESGILRAKEKNEVLILYNHAINDSGEDYSVSPSYLKAAFELCQKHGIKMIRMQDLNYFY